MTRAGGIVANADGSGEPDSPHLLGSALFDPVLGAKVLGEIQAEGLRAAGSLVERLVHLVDGPSTSNSVDSSPDLGASEQPASSGPSAAALGAVRPWFDLWSELVERTSDTLQRFRTTETGPDGTGVQVGIDGSLVPSRALTITVGSNGHGCGEMWLHNGTTADHGRVTPRTGSLTGADGAALACDVTIDPPSVESLVSKSSRGFAISVTVPPSAATGMYRGVIQVEGADAVWMPFEVVVSARPS
jgi:hypothetical protein